jgi:hypothetical protein
MTEGGRGNNAGEDEERELTLLISSIRSKAQENGRFGGCERRVRRG